MISSELKDTFLTLVRQGIGTAEGSLESVNWAEVRALAKKHGLSAVVLDGANSMAQIGGLPAAAEMDYLFKKQWIGTAVKSYEYRYESYKKAISTLAAFYNSHGFKMMVLKGYACSLDWPNPSHRPSGDIDVWLFGQYKEADRAMSEELGVKISESRHHHTSFHCGKFLVENHFDFVNVFAHKSNRGLEKIYKELGEDDSHSVLVNGNIIYLPSPNLHALFLLRHMANHFTSSSINVRQLLDWAFFANNHHSEIDWKWLLSVLEQYHMTDFFNTINAICVNELGFKESVFPKFSVSPSLKDKVLDDIIFPKYEQGLPSKLLPRLQFKYHRWKDNIWKRDFCYKEKAISSLMSAIRSHILKPSSI